MIVCHCHGLTDREVRSAVRHGARTVSDVSRRCGAGSACGGCRPTIEFLVSEQLVSRRKLVAARERS